MSRLRLWVGLLALLLATAAVAQQLRDTQRFHPLLRSLVAWYPTFPYLVGGLRWYDLAGSNHGTLTNGPTWGADSSGRFEGAVRFAPTDDNVTIPDAPAIDFGTGPFTVCFSLTVTTGLTVDSEYMLLSKSATYQGVQGWYISIYTFGAGATDYAIAFVVTAGVDLNNHSVGVTTLPIQRLIPVCAVRSGTTGTLYTFGVQGGAQTHSDWGLSVDNTLPLILGLDAARIDITQIAPMAMSHVLLYNRALSASEIQLLSTCSAPTYCGMVQEPDLPVVGQAGIRRRVINQ
jgi:Concanavalin A-like lectin/glucanases superfamily